MLGGHLEGEAAGEAGERTWVMAVEMRPAPGELIARTERSVRRPTGGAMVESRCRSSTWALAAKDRIVQATLRSAEWWAGSGGMDVCGIP